MSLLKEFPDNQLWLDGEWLRWDEAQIGAFTHTLHYGTGVFEGVRAHPTANGPMIFRLREHTERLLRSAEMIGMSLPFDLETLDAAQCEVVRLNGLDDAYIRPLAFYGDDSIGVNPSSNKVRVMIAAIPWSGYFAGKALDDGIRVKISSYRKVSNEAMPVHAKATGSYLNSALAVREARASGADEALLMDDRGCLAEGSGENLFLVINGDLHTPDTSNCLIGITRDSIMTIAGELGIKVYEQSITRDQLMAAEEVFLTGTAASVVPVTTIDGQPVGTGKRGPVTEQLQTRYFDTIHGRDSRHPEWLTPIVTPSSKPV